MLVFRTITTLLQNFPDYWQCKPHQTPGKRDFHPSRYVGKRVSSRASLASQSNKGGMKDMFEYYSFDSVNIFIVKGNL
jgi:hypothetical protein